MLKYLLIYTKKHRYQENIEHLKKEIQQDFFKKHCWNLCINDQHKSKVTYSFLQTFYNCKIVEGLFQQTNFISILEKKKKLSLSID